LEEAQSCLRKHGEHSIQKTALFCIDHALRLVKAFSLTLDEESEAFLAAFRARRDEIAAGCGMAPFADDGLFNSDIVGTAADGSMTAEDILIAEATTTLALADQQYDEGDHDAAAKNFHTATIYFRVLESMVPRLTPRVHAYLIYAAYRTQESSTYYENLVHEHFDGTRCVDVYEIVESKRLGKGSYGSVYLCRHRKTGDEFACKVIGMNRINSHYLRKLHLEISIMKTVDHPNIIKVSDVPSRSVLVNVVFSGGSDIYITLRSSPHHSPCPTALLAPPTIRAKIRDVFFGSRTVYLVMELCKGGELFDEITRKASRGMSDVDAGRMMADMISAVRYMHHRGIAHRDLKLENFLFEVSALPTSAPSIIGPRQIIMLMHCVSRAPVFVFSSPQIERIPSRAAR